MADYGKLKVTELKEMLKERGIPSTGLSRKAQIVEALEAYDARSEGKLSPGRGHVAEVGEEVGQDGNGQEETLPVGEDVVGKEGVVREDVGDSKELESPKEEAQISSVEASSTPAPAVEKPLSPAEDAKETTNTPQPTSIPEATVLENNEALSKEPSALATPTRTSPAAESQSSDTRKRKRRSPTPPPSEESVNKRLKAADEGEVAVKLPEDQAAEDAVVEDAPVPVDESAETLLPNTSSDDTANVTDVDPTTSKRMRSQSPSPRAQSPVREQDDEPSVTQAMDVEEPPEDTTTTQPAIHPATRALYIRDLVRPLQPNQLRTHLNDVATPPSKPTTTSSSSSTIETFHLDALRTHAFVLFTSTPTASRARAVLHNRVWPDEPSRKPLWVDFIPEDKAKEWIDLELNSTSGRRADAKRFEVVYQDSEEGDKVATLLESAPSSGASTLNARQPIFSTQAAGQGQGQGMPNAPLGPRNSRPNNIHQPPPGPPPGGLRRPSGPSQQHTDPSPQPQQKSTSFTVLDDRFPSTTTKPKLYYLPVSDALAAKRLSNLEAITRPDWDDGGGGAGADRGGRGDRGELRRYTFEDGERVVDGGADMGSFGRGERGGFGGGGRGRGGGGGGGGGFRGGRR